MILSTFTTVLPLDHLKLMKADTGILIACCGITLPEVIMINGQKIASDSDEYTPEQILELAFEQHDRVTISFSGAEDVVLIDMACNIADEVSVFTLDTGRLHAETYEFIEAVREFYGISIDILSPDPALLSSLVREKGLFSFYEDGHTECCGIRKIDPLRKHLSDLDAWITGQRRDQSPTRQVIPYIETDRAFSTEEKSLIKYNPLANWSSADVWQYIHDNKVPYNKLHDQGYRSIGCQPCTRPTEPGQQEREGRWWWEQATEKECGLHGVNNSTG